MTTDPRARRFVAVLLVVGIHAVLLFLALMAVRRERPEADTTAGSTLLMLRNPERVAPRSVMTAPTPQAPRMIDDPLSLAPPALSFDGAADAEAGPDANAPSIDWKEHGRRAAASTIEKMPAPDQSNCDSTGLGDPALANCKPPPDFQWAPPRSGFKDGLPYVMVGENCIVGLGFFGCALGKKPANGRLLDGMRDPQRERSSVPDSN